MTFEEQWQIHLLEEFAEQSCLAHHLLVPLRPDEGLDDLAHLVAEVADKLPLVMVLLFLLLLIIIIEIVVNKINY